MLYHITLLPQGTHIGTKHRFYVHIEIFKKFKYFILIYPIKALYCNLSMYSVPYRNCIHNGRSEVEPSGSKFVKDFNK